jgi:hypothetical protein
MKIEEIEGFEKLAANKISKPLVVGEINYA